MAYNKNLYTSSTDALDAGIIYDTNITKMQSEINAMLNKYMVIIGEATFDEEAVDPQTSQTTQYYDFSPESGSSDTINLVDGDVVLIKFPQAHPFLTTNHNRIWILTNAGYTSYLVSSGDVVADRAYQTHFAFKFNGTFLIPFDINGAQEHYNELKTNLNDVETNVGKILPVITGSTNNSGYTIASGDYFEANGALYKATASIPVGSAWGTSATAQSGTAINTVNSSVVDQTPGNTARVSCAFLPGVGMYDQIRFFVPFPFLAKNTNYSISNTSLEITNLGVLPLNVYFKTGNGFAAYASFQGASGAFCVASVYCDITFA